MDSKIYSLLANGRRKGSTDYEIITHFCKQFDKPLYRHHVSRMKHPELRKSFGAELQQFYLFILHTDSTNHCDSPYLDPRII